MNANDAKANLQAQLDAQALADRVPVDREDLERVLKFIDGMQARARSFPQPSGGTA